MKDKLTDDEKSKVQSCIDRMKDAVKAKDVDAIKKLDVELTQIWQPISTRIYQQGQQSQAEPTVNEAPKTDDSNTEQADEIQDAEFTVVD